jgi:hypothetical protein
LPARITSPGKAIRGIRSAAEIYPHEIREAAAHASSGLEISVSAVDRFGRLRRRDLLRETLRP